MELSERPLEAELAAIAESAEPVRAARLAVRHWGWAGSGGATLEAAGGELGITRERVRQLCDRLAELCDRLPGVSVAGEVMYAEGAQTPPDVFETTELKLLRLLREAGKEADRRDIEVACLAAGMRLSSFNDRIAYIPINRDLEHGRYGLCGMSDGEAPDPARRDLPARPGDAVPRPGDLASLCTPRRR